MVVGVPTGNSARVIIVGAGAAGISAASKLLENGYNDVVLLEAQDRIGGRIHTIPFGKGFVDMGAQWCQGEAGNVVYELVNDHYEFGDSAIRHNTTYAYISDGNVVEKNNFVKVMNLIESIEFDFENMAKFNGSIGEFFEIHFRNALREDSEFAFVDEELADQLTMFAGRGMNTLFASETWFELSAKLNAFSGTGDTIDSNTYKVIDK